MGNINKKQIFYKSILTLALSFILMSCGNRSRSKIQVDQGSFARISGLGFQDVFNDVIDQNCLGCHDSWNDYQTVRGFGTDRMLDAIISGRMPKGGPILSFREQSIFNSWVQDGSPEVAGQESGDMKLEPNYKSILVKVFSPKCIACHDGSENAPGPASINLSTYEDLIASNELYAERFGVGFLDVEFPEDSEIIFLLEEGAEEPMPPLTLPGSPDYVRPESVTAEELEVIIEWIRQGLPSGSEDTNTNTEEGEE